MQLFGDRGLASMIGMLIENAKEDKEKVREILRKALGR